MKRRIGIVLLLSVFLLTGCKKEPTWQDQYDLGMKYLEEGDYEEALASFQAAVAIDDKKTEAYTQMLTVYEEQNEESQAEETIWDMVDKVKKEEIAYEDTYDFWENVVNWCKNNDREDLIDEIYYVIWREDEAGSPLHQYYVELGIQYEEYYNTRLDYFFTELLSQTNSSLKTVWSGNENMWYASRETALQEKTDLGTAVGDWGISFYDDELGRVLFGNEGSINKAGNYKLSYCRMKFLDKPRKTVDFYFGRLYEYIGERDSGYEVGYHYNDDGSVMDIGINQKFIEVYDGMDINE